MLVDSHCHLDLIKGHSPESLVESAQARGVDYFLCVAVDFENIPMVLGIANRLPKVFASVGIHPNTSASVACEAQTLVSLANAKKVVAIGETGLDYFRSQGDLGWQQQRFREHIRAARIVNKPLIIHCREAALDTLRILREEKASEGVMHCFVEDWETARQVLEMGFYISFSGIVTFKNASVLQEVARKVPLDRLLVETDAPYLAPVPHRGQLNQPAYVRYVAEFIATLRKEPVSKVAQMSTQNFFRLFNTASP